MKHWKKGGLIRKQEQRGGRKNLLREGEQDKKKVESVQEKDQVGEEEERKHLNMMKWKIMK